MFCPIEVKNTYLWGRKFEYFIIPFTNGLKKQCSCSPLQELP